MKKEVEADSEKLLYMAIHDLKNQLTLVKANIACLTQMGLDARANELALLSKFGAERMLDMVTSMLDSHKIRNGKMTLDMARFDICELAVELAKEFEMAAQMEMVTVSVEAGGQVWIEGDKSMIRRTLSNLLDNAMRHSPEGGTVEVEVVGHDDSASVRVTDAGDGVKPEDRAGIFDPFRRATAGGEKNYGIGLAFCKMAVEAHGGEIRVENAPGGGALFIVTLPGTAPDPYHS